jgi:two-component system, OmpR family, response regulator RegX3
VTGGRILIADDDPGVVDVLAYALRKEGYAADGVSEGEAAVAAALERPYDLIILDLMLPDVSGMDVCRRLRAESSVPILMLTAKDGEVDRVLGLEIGADDYVTKPFSMNELVSRVRAILRRRELDREESGRAIRRVGGLHIDFSKHEVRVDDESVHLTLSEFKVLAVLAGEPEKVFTRRQIMQRLWESEHVGDEHPCDVHISNLRRKIERNPGRPERIITVRGVGYRLVPA